MAGSSHGRSTAAQFKCYQASNFFERRWRDTFRDFCFNALPTFFGGECLTLLQERIMSQNTAYTRISYIQTSLPYVAIKDARFFSVSLDPQNSSKSTNPDFKARKGIAFWVATCILRCHSFLSSLQMQPNIYNQFQKGRNAPRKCRGVLLLSIKHCNQLYPQVSTSEVQQQTRYCSKLGRQFS